MALIARVYSLSVYKHKCFLFSSVIRFSTHHKTYRTLPNVQFSQNLSPIQRRYKSSTNESKKSSDTPNTEMLTGNKLSQRARFKQAVRDYGATLIVFHVAIALTSLGLCYIGVSNGIDAANFLKFIGIPESVVSNDVAVEGSTFVMAYAVHKVFAPVRIGITLTAVPFIVRYLRKIKLIKPPK